MLTATDAGYSDSKVKSATDGHLDQFVVPANQSASLNQYISKSISMMIDQIHGIIYYKNNSFQECLTILNDATQREFDLVTDNLSPSLTFARSSGILSIHLLLIHGKYQPSSVNLNL